MAAGPPVIHFGNTRFLLGAVYCFICARTRGAGWQYTRGCPHSRQ